MNFRSIGVGVALVASLSLGLGACSSPDPEVPPAPEVSTSASASPSESADVLPSESPAEAVDPALDLDGDGELSGFEKEQAERRKGTEYTMSDGSTVRIPADEPVPEKVVADLKAKYGGDSNGMREEIAEQTGRTVLTVYLGADADGNPAWAWMDSNRNGAGTSSKEEAVRIVEERAATAPGKYLVIVFD